MRKLALPLIVVASLAASSAAMAATTVAPTPTMTDGIIKAMNAKACTIRLDNKVVYHFDAKCDFSKLKVGEKVTITWVAKGKLDWASKVAAVTA